MADQLPITDSSDNSGGERTRSTDPLPLSRPLLTRPILITAIIFLALLAILEYGFERYFLDRTYSYYKTTEVYWEDQHTLLLYLPDPHTMWRLRPSIDLSVREWIQPYGPEPRNPILYEWQITTNARGFREREFEARKTPNTMRVLCLGDSRTLGEGLDADATYPGRLAVALGSDVEVLNLAADGWSAFQGRRLLEHEGLSYNPDVVVACFGINDSDRAWGYSDSVRADRLDTAFTRIQKLLYRSMTFYAASRLYLKAKSYVFGKTPIGVGYGLGPPRLTPADYGREISRMREICANHDIPFVYMILPVSAYYPWRKVKTGGGLVTPFHAYNEQAIGRQSPPASLTVDMRNGALDREPAAYFIDDMHLSERGAQTVADRVAEAIVAYLDDR